MIDLTREIRFSLVSNDDPGPVTNSWAGWPSTNRIAPFLVVSCTVSGQADPETGYVCNIALLDELLRDIVVRTLIPGYEPAQTAEQMLLNVYRHATSNWQNKAKITSIALSLSPFLNFTINAEDPQMICLTQQFEFSASHRLHCDDFSDDENQRIFGKCNNPHGHGHNYVVEVTVAREFSDDSGQVIGLSEFESTVKKLVVDRLDHKHLNQDVDYFSTVIPSVENIAIAIWNWLDGETGKAKLECVRVYETPKTWAEYRGARVPHTTV